MIDMVHSNIYIENFVRHVYHHKDDNELLKKIRELEKIDSILEYQKFKDAIVDWKSNGDFKSKLHRFSCVGGESYHYGHIQTFYKYAGINEKRMDIILPEIEHGIDWYERCPNNIPTHPRHVFISQGSYRNKTIHDINAWLPIFNIGPYIHYASLYYSDTELLTLKKEWGRILLVFPFHCYEMSVAKYDINRFVDDIFTKYSDDFDTVLVCAYWNDVADPVYDIFESYGAKIVSNGFRGDSNFISRLRTLIYLSDATLGNDLGTHIGYSVFMGKPHILVADNEVALSEPVKILSTFERDLYGITLNQFKQDFSYENYKLGRLGNDSKQYIKFWGGKKYIKSPEEMRNIIYIAKDILSLTHGFYKGINSSVVKLLKEYKKKNDDMKYKLLADSLELEI